MLIIRQVKVIDKKEFDKAILNKDSKSLVVYIVNLQVLRPMIIHSSCVNQVLYKIAEQAIIKCDTNLIKILSQYQDYANVFFFNLAIELLENTRIKHTIKVIDNK